MNPRGIRRVSLLGWLLAVLLPVPSLAHDVPVAGVRLRLSADLVRVVLRDGVITPPFSDLGATGATLRIHGGAGSGQCYLVVDLPAQGWSGLGRNGAARGFRFRDAGVRATVGQGRIAIDLRGEALPCALEAALREPITVVVEAGDTRYCAAFGSDIVANEPGRFRARRAPAPGACPSGRVSVASLNILHGLACGDGTFCRFADRRDLLFRWIEDAGCPDVVSLQEVSIVGAPEIRAALPGLCEGAYAEVYFGLNFFDDEMHLVRHPVVASEEIALFKGFRTALFTRTDHPLGPLDVVSTHLASGADRGGFPCGSDCPVECTAAGAVTIRDCHAVQLALFTERVHDVPTPAVVTGDFNQLPGSFVHRTYTERGWSDVYADAGRSECDATTGVGCTSGRIDDAVTDLESPQSHQSQRIDFLFLVPPSAGRCELDAEFTRIFADEPNPFAPACGPAPLPVCWPSDHEGMQLGLDCGASGD